VAALTAAAVWLRSRRPIAALGIALFIGSHLLTGTILPLELIYEHRNYFASLGLLLVVVPVITHLPLPSTPEQHATRMTWRPHPWLSHGLALAPIALLLAWLAWQTATTAYAWGEPLRLAKELAARAPESPRAQYELGRTYIIYSNYDPSSPFTRLAYAPLEKAASLPKSSILPQQALIFMNARMHLPIEEKWWDTMIAKLQARKPGVQDESSLIALMHCMRDGLCDLPKQLMHRAFQAAIAHPDPSARILATYGEFAWNQLSDVKLGEQLMSVAVKVAPTEAAYRVTLFRMFVSERRFDEARKQLDELQRQNIGGYLDHELATLRDLLPRSDKSM
jgi:protein O-mannosyl-transferase